LPKYAQDLDVNIELSTWDDAGTFKAKYTDDAKNFKCNILSFPLNEFDFLSIDGQSS